MTLASFLSIPLPFCLHRSLLLAARTASYYVLINTPTYETTSGSHCNNADMQQYHKFSHLVCETLREYMSLCVKKWRVSQELLNWKVSGYSP